jgi:hypothetical protein
MVCTWNVFIYRCFLWLIAKDYCGERAASGPCVAVEVIRMDVDDTFEEEKKG